MSRKRPSHPGHFSSATVFRICLTTFHARLVIDTFGLNEFAQPELMSKMITNFRTSNNAHGVRHGEHRTAFWSLYYLSTSLIQLHNSVQSLVVAPKTVGIADDEGVLDI